MEQLELDFGEEHRLQAIAQNGNTGEHYGYVHVQTQPDMVNHPPHYIGHPSGVECIELTENLNFCLGNAVKYCFRAGSKKNSSETEDINKAIWYVERELERVSERYKVRGKYSRQSTECQDRQDAEAGSDKEWIYDVVVFFAASTAVYSCDGFRDVRVSAPTRFGRITLERKPSGQSTGQLGLGIRFREYPPQESAYDRTTGAPPVVSETDIRDSGTHQEQQPLTVENSDALRHFTNAGKPHTTWRKLAAFMNAEDNRDKAAAIFYLTTASGERDLEKALWYLQRLVKVL